MAGAWRSRYRISHLISVSLQNPLYCNSVFTLRTPKVFCEFLEVSLAQPPRRKYYLHSARRSCVWPALGAPAASPGRALCAQLLFVLWLLFGRRGTHLNPACGLCCTDWWQRIRHSSSRYPSDSGEHPEWGEWPGERPGEAAHAPFPLLLLCFSWKTKL